MNRIVAANETAEVLGSGGLPVYATPSMICHMELASFKLAEQYGHQTVGTKVEISHLRACKVGTEVKITAELTEVEGRRLEYIVKVEDEKGLLKVGKLLILKSWRYNVFHLIYKSFSRIKVIII